MKLWTWWYRGVYNLLLCGASWSRPWASASNPSETYYQNTQEDANKKNQPAQIDFIFLYPLALLQWTREKTYTIAAPTPLPTVSDSTQIANAEFIWWGQETNLLLLQVHWMAPYLRRARAWKSSTSSSELISRRASRSTPRKVNFLNVLFFGCTVSTSASISACKPKKKKPQNKTPSVNILKQQI